MGATFFSGTDWQESSERPCHVKVHEADMWPMSTRSGSGTKDTLTAGEHPVIAIGGRTMADGRPDNLTGVVVGFDSAANMAIVDVCPSRIVRQVVWNISAYSKTVASAWENAPIAGQPVFVDDSNDLAEGDTLSMSNSNDADIANPLAGYIFYCQDEYTDSGIGGPQSVDTFPLSWSDSVSMGYEVCVLLTNATPDIVIEF